MKQRKAVLTVQSQAAPAAGGIVGALEFPCGNNAFDITFDIHKDLTGKPNRATIDIFNLTEEHRGLLSEKASKGPTRVRLEAGYEDEGIHRIFEGDVRILYHDRDNGVDWKTRIETADGDRIVSTARISKSWASGTPVATVIKDLAAELDIGEGNVRASTAGALLEGLGTTFVGGTAASGRVFRELTRICKSAGIEWSIQDGTLQFLVTDQALSAVAVLVTADTGMEGSAKIDHKGRLHVKTRLLPFIWPGRKIQLENKAEWRVDKAHYHGQTRGHAWGIMIEATNPNSQKAKGRK